MSIRRKAAIAAVAATATLALAACGGDELQPNEEGNIPLTVFHITTVDSTPLHLGVEQGFFEEEGLDVTVEIAESGSAIIPSVVNGESPIGYANVVSDLAAIDQGLDIKFVGNCCGNGSDPESDTSNIFVLEDSTIAGPEDLPGTRIAVNSTKNLGDTTIPEALENLGIDPEGIEYVPMNYSDMGGALERGDVDAIWQVEPFRTLALDAGYRPVLANFTQGFPDTTAGYYITSGEFAENNPEVVSAFQRALSKANEYATENQDQLREMAVEHVGLEPSVAERVNFAEFKPGLDVEGIRVYGAAALKYGLIEEEPNYDEVVILPED